MVKIFNKVNPNIQKSKKEKKNSGYFKSFQKKLKKSSSVMERKKKVSSFFKRASVKTQVIDPDIRTRISRISPEDSPEANLKKLKHLKLDQDVSTSNVERKDQYPKIKQQTSSACINTQYISEDYDHLKEYLKIDKNPQALSENNVNNRTNNKVPTIKSNITFVNRTSQISLNDKISEINRMNSSVDFRMSSRSIQTTSYKNGVYPSTKLDNKSYFDNEFKKSLNLLNIKEECSNEERSKSISNLESSKLREKNEFPFKRAESKYTLSKNNKSKKKTEPLNNIKIDVKKFTKDTEENQQYVQKIMSYFNFSNQLLTDSLRLFMSKIPVIGEAIEVDRILKKFTVAYCDSNNIGFSIESLHVLVCSMVLLNTDIHMKGNTSKMSLKSYMLNLNGLCDSKNFDQIILTKIYNNIKTKPLPRYDQYKLTRATNEISNNNVNNKKPIIETNDKEKMLKNDFDFNFTDALKEYKVYPLAFTLETSIKLLEKEKNGAVIQVKSKSKIGNFKLFGPYLFFLYKTQYRGGGKVLFFLLCHSLAYCKQGSNCFYFRTIDNRVYEISAAEKSILLWKKLINLSASIFTMNSLPISYGSSPILTLFSLPFTISQNPLMAQLNSLEKKLFEYTEYISIAVKYKPHNQTELQELKKSLLFSKIQIEKYSAYIKTLIHSEVALLKVLKPFEDTQLIRDFCESMEKL